MKSTLKNSLFVSFVIGFILIGFNSLGFAVDSGAIQQKEHSGLKSPEKASKHKKESLSNQSPLNVYRQKYSYRYYPSCSVYYDVNRRLYFYPENDSWKIFAILPSVLERKLGHYVEIEMDNDKPYTDNDNHVKEFPAKDSKKTGNKMWSKLIYLLLYDHASK
jgi:hypothetical protein